MNQKSGIRVSQTVWPWRFPAAISKVGRIPRPWRAVIQAAIIAAVATCFLVIGHRYGIGLFLYGLSVVVLISGLFIPAVFHGIEKVGVWLGQGAGIGLTWLLLTPFYYLCVFPGRLVLIVLGKDPMCRRWDRRRDSYWIDRKSSDPKFYTRQY
ncbi:MAG: hypothetical protein KKG09_00010 [Verrucomicrobia bacterium]|nr:hypothetical protein [Verrucomicrobiota bacterium]MBU4289489.1 hypothetical protein [Verrucomicrobiota bacterium]MBU4429656.1 hypothetical protein [Verrucomicrobiota bacterium]MBU4496375.1 hypothetical protein [Verrucomicrobiota bacterium]MCG2678764.1 hypothetical protein [Kiritimatiellia bacterium]